MGSRARATSSVWQELQVFSDHLEFAAFLAGFLVVPSIHLQAAFDVGAASLGEILLGELRLAAPQGDIDEDGFFLFLVLFVVPDAVNGKGDVRDGGALGCEPQFRIPCEVPDEHDFIEIGHNNEEVGSPGGRCQVIKLFFRTILFMQGEGSVGDGRVR